MPQLREPGAGLLAVRLVTTATAAVAVMARQRGRRMRGSVPHRMMRRRCNYEAAARST